MVIFDILHFSEGFTFFVSKYDPLEEFDPPWKRSLIFTLHSTGINVAIPDLVSGRSSQTIIQQFASTVSLIHLTFSTPALR